MDIDLPTTSMSERLFARSHEPWDETNANQQATHQSAGFLPSPGSSRITAKPASPKVISSILASLDTFTHQPPHDLLSDEEGSGPPRLDSPRRSIASGDSVARKNSPPGFGVEYGRSLDLDEEEGVTNAALPPTIPTSRPPSGFSNRHSKRLSWSKPNPKAYFTNRSNSRRSSLTAVSNPDGTGSGRHKLSSESWVRSNNERAERDDWPIVNRGRTPHRGVRRVASQEMLRQAQLGPSAKRHEDSQSMSLAEQIIARHPPLPSSTRGRLYLTDATIAEDRLMEDSSLSPSFFSEPAAAPSPAQTTPSLEARENMPTWIGELPFEDQLSVKRGSTKSHSPITDSIPTRTSSLRHPSNSPAAGQKKTKKSKRQSGVHGKTGQAKNKRSSPVSDSRWADLDEDDETVKRIKELRDRRRSRLQESSTQGDDLDMKHAQEKTNEERAHGALSKPPLEGLGLQLAGGPLALHAVPAPADLLRPSKSIDDTDRPSISDNSELKSSFLSAESPKLARTSKGRDQKRPQSAHARPTTSRSERSAAPTISSDYSSAEPMGVLESVPGGNQLAKDKPSRESTERRRLSSRLKGFTFSDDVTAALPQHRLSKKGKKASQGRSTVQHPDLPASLERSKSRRKSMSDARAARAMDEGEQLARVYSIDNAVMEYLEAPRLTQKVKHPTTGRTIAFSEVGDPDGAAVFICVGMGLTRFVTAFYDELATTLRLRLITLDRPGVGASEPFPSHEKGGPLNWPEDVLIVSQHLGIVQFSILAHSAGAIYALATALILPDLVKGKVHLLAPWVPPSQLDAISHQATSAPPSNPLPRSQRFLRALPTPFLKVANTSFMTATSASLQPTTKRSIKTNTARTARRAAGPTEPPSERPVSQDRPEYNRRESMMLMDQYMPSTHPLDNYPLPVKPLEGEVGDGINRTSLVLSATATPADPSFTYATTGLNAAEHAERERHTEYARRLTQYTWDLATRDSNPATDLVVCLERNRDVGFRYTDVGREVVITHGAEDKRVPIANVKWLAEQMNRRNRESGPEPTSRDSHKSYVDNASTSPGGCELRVLEGEGHGLMASPTIMADVLEEIAGYWLVRTREEAIRLAM